MTTIPQCNQSVIQQINTSSAVIYGIPIVSLLYKLRRMDTRVKNIASKRFTLILRVLLSLPVSRFLFFSSNEFLAPFIKHVFYHLQVRIYINLILDDLIKNLTSNLWRIRQASCLALSDILRNNQSQKSLPNDGKEVEENPADAISRRLSELWSTVFRVLDDIKESVRDAAIKTCKMLKKVR